MAAATIAAELERDRLEHRVRRMELVIAALRDRVLHRRAVTGAIPLPLRQAIAGFELELNALRHRLAQIGYTETVPRHVGAEIARDTGSPVAIPELV